ncbi:hypothetical protein CDL15_Pgr021828 [Punica granatum]|uniref:Uncharacterized protein n=1 Tax=Punica granatum TaxID=22663 RepID=A0A218WSQ1_PUNGR|nr:hypothetical protein CDL15_Pgr021828 [Punica granatum]PKI38363.1 hypothetical protein CRG98_041274 [Punica granatum]
MGFIGVLQKRPDGITIGSIHLSGLPCFHQDFTPVRMQIDGQGQAVRARSEWRPRESGFTLGLGFEPFERPDAGDSPLCGTSASSSSRLEQAHYEDKYLIK